MMQLSPQVNTAISLLSSAGYEAFLVGGAVRDYLRCNAPASDWDITTNALPEETAGVFSAYRIVETGLKHGTVTVMIDSEPIEITTYRVDGDYTDNRHPDSVRFTASLRDDLERRDFTMNAVAYNPALGIVDYVGGTDDISHRVIRCVGEPGRRFREDGLRILRALRFASVLGFSIEPGTAAAIHENAQLLKNIAAERVREELNKLLCGDAAANILTEYSDVLSVVIPELKATFGFAQHNPHHDKDVWAHTVAVVSAVRPETVLRWSALLHDLGKPECFAIGCDGLGHFYGHAHASMALAKKILYRLRFDNESCRRILELVKYHDLPLSADRKALRRLLGKLGAEALDQLIELHRADTMGLSPDYIDRLEEFERAKALVNDILAEGECFSLKDLAINGHDLISLGLRGVEIGRTLNECLEAVVEERLSNEREILMDYAALLSHNTGNQN